MGELKAPDASLLRPQARGGGETKAYASRPAPRDLNKLNTFVRVAQRLSFTRAAADLRTTPSVVSKHMKELEDSLGVSLLTRSTHGISLTDSGEGLFQHCMHMLNELDGFLTDVRNRERGLVGTLRVQATDDLARWLALPRMIQFNREHPNLKTQLAVIPDEATPAEEGFDVILATRRPSLPGLTEHDLGEIPHVVCGAPRYFAHHGVPKDPHELRAHICLVNRASGAKEWPFNVGGRHVDIEIGGPLSCNTQSLLIDMAIEGCGVVRAPRHAVEADLARRTLSPILEAQTRSPERAWAFISKAKRLPLKTNVFLDFLKRVDGVS